MGRPVYVMQPAFTGGEISDDVASRVDLEKYQLALLNAENAIVRPYGAVKKRTGTAYCGTTKNNAHVVLKRFDFASELSYLLEFGVGYLRIWRQGTYINVELSTPFTAADLDKIRTVQSIDVMYICTGTHPVQKLSRYSESEWTLGEVDWTLAPFEDEPPAKNVAVVPRGEDGEFEVFASGEIFTEANIGDYIKIEQRISGDAISRSITTSSASHTTNAFSSAAGRLTIEKTGASTATVKLQKQKSKVIFEHNLGGQRKETFEWVDVSSKQGDAEWTWNINITYPTSTEGPYTISYTGKLRLVITGLNDTPLNLKVTTAKGSTGTYANKVIEFNDLTSNKVYTGNMRVGEQWKIITHGLWKGTLYLQISYDEGSSWTTIRTYTGNEDFNPTESGTVEEMALVRVYGRITSGTCKIDLSTYAYKNYGYGKIIGYVDPSTVFVGGIKHCEAGVWSEKFYLSAWGQTNKYPRCATFFQDRLVLGGNDRYPQRIWMSRNGDYENFEVEKVSGTVTDDSAISADLLSQQPFTVKHMMAANDLVILTEGNTWTISGAETVTPSSIAPRNQEAQGANDVRIMHVGARTVYVQRRGSAVRDVGYTYDTDSYTGMDLSLLAKHLVRGKKLVDGDYAREPDSAIYFVREDGVMLCLTYIPEQKVYGWSHFVTDGKYESVCVISEGNEDRVYAVINRTIGGATKRYLERFALDAYTDRQQDYKMLDSYTLWNSAAGSATITGLSHLNGKKVQVIADNYYYDDQEYTVTNGQIVLPEAVHEAIVGLPYSLVLEQPNFEVGNTETGTMQGRMKNVVSATLRVTRSYGGVIGPHEKALNKIIFDRDKLELGEDALFTGDKRVVLGIGGHNLAGRTFIKQEEPFPFNLSAIIREVTFSDL